MNGSARGALLKSNGMWATRGPMSKFGFVCEKRVRDFCLFDMIEYHDNCFDFRLNERTDLHSWEGAVQGCVDYGMKMMQISQQPKDEFVNWYLWNTGMFTSESQFNGMWLGGEETEKNCEFAWTSGDIIGSPGWFDSINHQMVHCNANNHECLYHGPCDTDNYRECKIK